MLFQAQLEIFKHLFRSVAEEMGVVMQRSAYSPNIKERLDFSCALFDPSGEMVAQAAHIPVHLGSMPLSVEAAADAFHLEPGDLVVLNDPSRAARTCPTCTVVSPVFRRRAAARLRRQPGSPRGHRRGVPRLDGPRRRRLRRRHPHPAGPLVPARRTRGATCSTSSWPTCACRQSATATSRRRWRRTARERLASSSSPAKYGAASCCAWMERLMDYTEAARAVVAQIPDGAYSFEDAMEDDGRGGGPFTIAACVRWRTAAPWSTSPGTAPQAEGPVNCVSR